LIFFLTGFEWFFIFTRCKKYFSISIIGNIIIYIYIYIYKMFLLISFKAINQKRVQFKLENVGNIDS